MPIAVAFRNARNGIDGLRTRPMGKPEEDGQPGDRPQDQQLGRRHLASVSLRAT